MKSLIKKINEPFPASNNGIKAIKEIIFTGLFVALFLLFFNPFGLQNMPLGVVGSSAVFGLITIFFCFSFKVFVTNILRIETDHPSWTLGKWLLMTFTMVCWVAVGNFIYLLLSLPQNFNISDFLKMLKYTVMVGITPVVISGLLIQLRALKENNQKAMEIQSAYEKQSRQATVPKSQIIFEVGSGNNLNLYINDIFAIEAMQNYLVLYYYDEHGHKIKNTLIRKTMSSAENQFSSTDLMRCHRSFIVNIAKIDSISGNAQGLKLKLIEPSKLTIPVFKEVYWKC